MGWIPYELVWITENTHKVASMLVSISNVENSLKIQCYDHELTWEVDFWFHDVIKGYALKFVIECHQFFTKAMEFFKKGPCGRLIDETLFWINMILVEWGSMLSFPREIEA